MASAAAGSVGAAADRPARVVCVLGMHRSGTSYLIGSLQQRGLFLGKHHTWNEYNLRGNRENQDIWELHDGILKANGGAWDRPPPVVDWKPEHFERAKRILAEYAAHAVWGFKDPRTLLTLDGWLKLVPDLEPVGIFRHPTRVARSLERRDEMPKERALDLWLLYNRRLLELHRRGSFPILSFDDDAAILETKLSQAAGMLGLDTGSVDDPFFAEDLRQAAADDEVLPDPVQQLHEELKRISL
jgi:hypothetical protein